MAMHFLYQEFIGSFDDYRTDRTEQKNSSAQPVDLQYESICRLLESTHTISIS